MPYSKSDKRPGLLARLVNWSKLRLKRDPLLVSLLVLAGLYFLFYYLSDPVRPAGVFGLHDKAVYAQGWFGFNDQGYYLKLAHTLASFNFHQLHTTFLYGLGYPIVAVPFIWLGFDKDPFVFFNLFAFVFAIYATYRVAKAWISPVAGLLAGFGLAFATPLVHYTDQPWNTTVCLVAVSGILLVSITKKVTKWHAIVLGLLVGWAFAARYVDAAFLGVLAIVSLYRNSLKGLSKQFIYIFIGLSIFVIPVLYTHYRIFGSPLKTPYVLHKVSGQAGSDQQLTSYSIAKIPRKTVAIFLSPKWADRTDSSRGLLVDMFWTLTAIPGAYILFRRTSRKLFLVTLVGFTVVVALFYLSFRGTAIDSVRFGLLHYFKILWPGMVILSVAFFDHQFNKVLELTQPQKRRQQ